MIESRLLVGSIRFCILLPLLLLLLSACRPEGNKPMIDVNLDRPHDSSATVIVADGRAFIDVTDPRGINGLNAQLTTGEWPEEVVVLLRLRGLENLEIGYGDFTITTGRSSNDSPDPPLMLSVVDEQGQVQTASPSADIYFPDIYKTEDGFEITLPPHFFQGNYTAFSMRWIDFYRN